eukprot:jgi/Phyca11/532969/estExt2_fgenesh1_pg.C_PHYCAscaffold_90152
MGASQSLDVVFGSPNLQTDSGQGDVYQYLRRVEKSLWLTEPWWEHKSDLLGLEDAANRTHTPRKQTASTRDSFKKMTPSEALNVIPSLLDEMWVSPLVALVDCEDPIARSAGLALLSRIVQQESLAKIFITVRGMDKVMALLDSQDQQAVYMSLEVIFALCAGSRLVKGEQLELVLASLKVLRVTLRQDAV